MFELHMLAHPLAVEDAPAQLKMGFFAGYASQPRFSGACMAEVMGPVSLASGS